MSFHKAFYFAAAGLVLIALADPLPGLAIWIVSIIIVGYILTHISDYEALLRIPK